MPHLTWRHLANGDMLAREHPIRLVKPLSRRADDPGWTIRVPQSLDPLYDHLDGWQWSDVLDKGSAQLEETSARALRDLVESTVYFEYVLGWIPEEYGEWTDERRQRIADDVRAAADRFPRAPRQPRPRTPKRAPATQDPYEAIGLRRPDDDGWPATLQLSRAQYVALRRVLREVSAPDAVAGYGEDIVTALNSILIKMHDVDPRGRKS